MTELRIVSQCLADVSAMCFGMSAMFVECVKRMSLMFADSFAAMFVTCLNMSSVLGNV